MPATVNIPLYPSAEGDNATVIYAVGDIHGRLDLLESMEGIIADDLANIKAERAVVCYLGDYVDRGPQSAQVIDRLQKPSALAATRIFLKGNHEDRMLAFLTEPASHGAAWLDLGGKKTLSSYGVSFNEVIESNDWGRVRDDLLNAMRVAHVEFLKNLRLAFVWHKYVFVHAGIHPDNPLEAQEARDLVWIREPFISSGKGWDYRIVHGHVKVPEPVFRPNRIGIDTGAYESGRLTCLAVSDDETRVLQAIGG